MLYNSGTNSIVADVHYWAGSDSVTYPILDITRNANQALSKVVEMIMRSAGRWQFDDTNYDTLPIATTDLVANQTNFSLDVSHLKVARVRIKDEHGKWRILRPVDRRDLSEEELNATGTPDKYDKLGVSLFFFPLQNYDYPEGVEVQFERDADYFTVDDTTKAPGFASTFHRLISLYTALDYTEPNELEARSRKIQKRIDRMEAELVEFYSDRDRDEQPFMQTEGNREYAVDSYGAPWFGEKNFRGWPYR